MRNTPDPVPEPLSRAWPHLPEHVKTAILALVGPYLPPVVGVG